MVVEKEKVKRSIRPLTKVSGGTDCARGVDGVTDVTVPGPLPGSDPSLRTELRTEVMGHWDLLRGVEDP